MSLSIGIENGIEGRTIAWALEHPGCFSYGESTLESLRALPAAVDGYNGWLILHGLEEHLIMGEQTIHIEDTGGLSHQSKECHLSRRILGQCLVSRRLETDYCTRDRNGVLSAARKPGRIVVKRRQFE